MENIDIGKYPKMVLLIAKQPLKPFPALKKKHKFKAVKCMFREGLQFIMNLPVTPLKLAFFMLVHAVLLFMILAIPLGLEVFFLEKISQSYTFESLYLIKLLDFRLEVTVGLAFIILLTLYTLCLIVSFRKESAFIKDIRWLFTREKEITQLMKNHLFALPLLSSLAYVTSKIIHLIQDFYSIPLGEAPLSKDPLIAFLELSTSPIIEEFIFRILPIGTFLATYFISIINTTKRTSPRWTIKFLISIFRDPEGGKRVLGLKTIKDHGFLSGIGLREWLMIILTSAIFSFSHYVSTWDVGKLLSSFIQGLIMGLSYVAYGFQAPIIIHWFLNYHLYTYNLVKMVNPKAVVLAELNDFFTIASGISGLIITLLFGIRNVMRVSSINIKALIMRWILGLKSSLEIKGNEVLKKARHINLRSLLNLNFALLILFFMIFIVRLLIITFPSPERGEKYYDTGLVFDEAYYVKAARSLLRGEPANNEHPPLAKLFILVGILIFGDNPVGWRLPMIISSSLSVILLYMLTLKAVKNRLASFFTSIIFMLDIMAFNIGQIAILDPPSLMFILLACIMLIEDKRDLSGVFFGLALLCKLNSLFSLGISLFLLLKMVAESGRFKLKNLMFEWMHLLMRIFLISFVIFLLGIWIYDAIYGAFGGNPLNHLIYMFNYHSALTYKSSEDVILPLSWINPLNPFSPIPYYVVTAREVLESGVLREYHPIAYYGLYSPLWWSIWLIVPLSLKKIIKDRDSSSLFIFIWITTNFLPYIILAYILHRWVYPFYFCMTLPGLYMGLSYYSTSLKRQKILLALLTLIQALWFIIWFPVKPKALIDFLSFLNLPV